MRPTRTLGLKELRAQAPIALAFACAIVLLKTTLPYSANPFGLGVYALTVVMVGARVFGHEFAHHTMTSLLSQPFARRRVLAVKLVVLASFLTTLWTVANWWLVLDDLGAAAGNWRLWRDIPPIVAFGLTPWLTLVGRGALAGLLFSIAVPSLVSLGSSAVSLAVHGWAGQETPDATALRTTLAVAGILTTCGIGAVMTWVTFLRGNVAEPALASFVGIRHRTRPSSSFAFRGRAALLLLIGKELRLQQPAFIVAGLSLLAWSAVLAVRVQYPGYAAMLGEVLAFLASVLIGSLAGSVTSAVERETGVLELQALQPVSARVQWLIKAGTAMAVSIFLGSGIPAILQFGSESRGVFNIVEFSGLSVAVTVLALFVSSVLAKAVTALHVTALSGVALFALAQYLSDRVATLVLSTFGPRAADSFWLSTGTQVTVMNWLEPMAGGLSAIVGLLLLHLAFRNHRVMAIGRDTLLRQYIAIAAIVGFAVAVPQATSSLVAAGAYHAGPPAVRAVGWVAFHVTEQGPIVVEDPLERERKTEIWRRDVIYVHELNSEAIGGIHAPAWIFVVTPQPERALTLFPGAVVAREFPPRQEGSGPAFSVLRFRKR